MGWMVGKRDEREEGGFAAVGVAEEEDCYGWWVVHQGRLVDIGSAWHD